MCPVVTAVDFQTVGMRRNVDSTVDVGTCAVSPVG